MKTSDEPTQPNEKKTITDGFELHRKSSRRFHKNLSFVWIMNLSLVNEQVQREIFISTSNVAKKSFLTAQVHMEINYISPSFSHSCLAFASLGLVKELFEVA